MAKTRGTSPETKVFGGKRYRYFRGLFSSKAAAVRQAKILRSEGRLARVTHESYQEDWTHPEWVVWVK